MFPALTFALPVSIAHAGDGDLFVVEQTGRIWLVEGWGAAASKTLFLDISNGVQSGGEQGLLGLAFHPQYKQNRYLYVNYTALVEGRVRTIIARFQVAPDGRSADPQSELVLLQVDQPYSNHNGGDLHFDPQGMLVIALGDGGSGGDPLNNGQDPQSLLGKLLRIDVNRAADGRNYTVPGDNPFVGDDGIRDEIWMLGLRNPWRFSFDRQSGDLTIADVGQNVWEEINIVPAAAAGGQNFGWRLKEGFVCFNPASNCDPGSLTDPVWVYDHDVGCSVTGGYVYRGARYPALQGTYIYADYCTGTIYGLAREGTADWQNRVLVQGQRFLSTFGETSDGELLFADRANGRIYGLTAGYHRQMIPLVLR